MEDTTNASMADSAAQASAEIAATTPEADSTSTQDQATEQSSETQTSVPAQESFFDPNAVPQELLPAYKQMQADYTKKTQDLATERKALSDSQVKAEQFAKYEHLIPAFEEMLSPKTQQQAEDPKLAALVSSLKQEGYADEAVDLAKKIASFMKQDFTQVLSEKDQAQAKDQATKAWNAEVEKASQVDPRLKDDNLVYETEGGKMTFGEIVEGITMAQPNFRQDLVAATKRAVAIVDVMVGKAKSEGKAELSASANERAVKFPDITTSPQSAQQTDKTYSSMREAAQDAQAKLK